MKRSILIGLMAPALFLVGCASNQKFLMENEAPATQAVVNRAQFDLSCPNGLAASVLSKEVVQPHFEGRFYTPPNRAEYTVGVQGCGKKVVYIGICPENGTGCFAFPAKNESNTTEGQ